MHHHHIAKISCLDSVYLTCSFNTVKARGDLTKSESILSSNRHSPVALFLVQLDKGILFYGLDISLSLHNNDQGFSEY